MEKSAKWSNEAEAFWRENICGEEYTEIYNPFQRVTGVGEVAEVKVAAGEVAVFSEKCVANGGESA
jgi:hypothetical protein